MRNDFESNYLAHHGILGMKWGKKNGPPYPLGASDHSAAEKKAGYKKSLGGGRNEELYDRKTNESTKEKRHLTEQQKRYIKIGMAALGITAAAVGTVYLVKSGKASALINTGKSFINGNTPTSNAKILGDKIEKVTGEVVGSDTSQLSPEVKKAYDNAVKIAKNINPTGSNKNCGACSIIINANDRLGTNFQADDIAVSDYKQLSNFFKGYNAEKHSFRADPTNGLMTDDVKEEFDLMKDLLVNKGNGASGICSGMWEANDGASGHYVAWKVAKDKVIFIDGQNGNVYLDDAFDELFSRMKHGTLAYSRLDDLEPIVENIQKLAYNR